MPPDPQPDWVIARRRLLGKKIRDARLWADLTQMQLAEKVGVDHRTIHRIEYATSDPTLSVLLRIADAVRVPVGDLVSTDPFEPHDRNPRP